MKGKTCCVTGHRDLPQKEINHVRPLISAGRHGKILMEG